MLIMITGETSIEELVDKHPQSVVFLRERGIVCIVCGEPVWGTFEELLASKGRKEEVSALLKDLNELIQSS